MQYFIIGRDMHVLCVTDTESDTTLPIDDSGDSYGQKIIITEGVAIGTYDFQTDPRHPDAVNIKEGNYIAFRDKYDRTRLYTIMTVSGDNAWDVHCEDIGMDLINEDADAWDYSARSVADTLKHVIGDSGWSIGINEISDRKRATKYESNEDSKLTRLESVMNAFDAECDFVIEMTGTRVTKQVINIYKQLGEDKTQQRFINDINLISLSRSGSIEDLATCIYPKGHEENDSVVTIKDIVYDDGDFHSPKGDPRIYSRKANRKWNRFRSQYLKDDDKNGFIVRHWSYDTKSAQELFNRALSQLKKICDVKVSYEAKLDDLQADIGDYVQIADSSKAETVYLSARVQQVTNHYTVSGEDTGVLANYTILQSNISEDLKAIQEEIQNSISKLVSSVVDYAASASGTEAPADGWSAEIPEVEEGQYLWTRTTSTYSDGSTTVAYSISHQGEKGDTGKDAILVAIESSSGLLFKNSEISTTLTVDVYVGDTLITDSAALKEKFGDSAYLQWKTKKEGEKEWTDIPSTDSRLSDEGFIFTISPEDVLDRAVFGCDLYF